MDNLGYGQWVLGLPDAINSCLFDLDGVLTKTASVHAAAWKEMFDAFLRQWSDDHGTPFAPFDIHDDYDNYVDGKPRADGVRDFLQSRNIQLPEGDAGDGPEVASVKLLGDRKNALVLRRIRQDGVDVYAGSVDYVDAAQRAGLRCAVVSSSANTADVLHVTGLADRFEVVVDGVTVAQGHLRGKPAPDSYLEAARLLGVQPAHAAVFEDAVAGVQAGHDGHFGYVVGVDRVGQAAALAKGGADRVVGDLQDLLDAPDAPGASSSLGEPSSLGEQGS